MQMHIHHKIFSAIASVLLLVLVLSQEARLEQQSKNSTLTAQLSCMPASTLCGMYETDSLPVNCCAGYTCLASYEGASASSVCQSSGLDPFQGCRVPKQPADACPVGSYFNFGTYCYANEGTACGNGGVCSAGGCSGAASSASSAGCTGYRTCDPGEILPDDHTCNTHCCNGAVTVTNISCVSSASSSSSLLPSSSSSSAPYSPPARCGDGIKNGTDECDDGNRDETDACTNTCKLAKCGDNFIQEGVEQCDAGTNNVNSGIANMPWDDTDTQIAELSKSGCLDTCQKAQCSDGKDNDSNKKTDGADRGCKTPDTETPIPGYNKEQCPYCIANPEEELPPVAVKSFFYFFKNVFAQVVPSGGKELNEICDETGNSNPRNLSNDDCKGQDNFCKYISGTSFPSIGSSPDAEYRCKPLSNHLGPCTTKYDCKENYDANGRFVGKVMNGSGAVTRGVDCVMSNGDSTGRCFVHAARNLDYCPSPGGGGGGGGGGPGGTLGGGANGGAAGGGADSGGAAGGDTGDSGTTTGTTAGGGSSTSQNSSAQSASSNSVGSNASSASAVSSTLNVFCCLPALRNSCLLVSNASVCTDAKGAVKGTTQESCLKACVDQNTSISSVASSQPCPSSSAQKTVSYTQNSFFASIFNFFFKQPNAELVRGSQKRMRVTFTRAESTDAASAEPKVYLNGIALAERDRVPAISIPSGEWFELSRLQEPFDPRFNNVQYYRSYNGVTLKSDIDRIEFSLDYNDDFIATPIYQKFYGTIEIEGGTITRASCGLPDNIYTSFCPELGNGSFQESDKDKLSIDENGVVRFELNTTYINGSRNPDIFSLWFDHAASSRISLSASSNTSTVTSAVSSSLVSASSISKVSTSSIDPCIAQPSQSSASSKSSLSSGPSTSAGSSKTSTSSVSSGSSSKSSLSLISSLSSLVSSKSSSLSSTSSSSLKSGICCENGNCNPFGLCANPLLNFNSCAQTCGVSSSSIVSSSSSLSSISSSSLSSTPSCISICGNNQIECEEQCDDGNQYNDDGCTNICRVYINPSLTDVTFSNPLTPQEYQQLVSLLPKDVPLCTEDIDCPTSQKCIFNRCILPAQIAALPSFCSNSRVDPGEVCDNGSGNSNNPNAVCRFDCRKGGCGDGIVDTPLEQCDDGNVLSDDGCDSRCLPERLAPTPAQTLPAQVIELPIAIQKSSTPKIAYQQPVQPKILPPPIRPVITPSKAPSTPDSGPAALAVMLAGGAAGWLYRRRR